MPIREDQQRRLARIPGLAVAIGQGVRQGIAHLQLGQFAQKVLQRQVFVGEAMQDLQPLTLVVIQITRTTQTEQRQVEQVIQLVPARLRFTVDHAQGGFRLCDGVWRRGRVVWSLGAGQTRLDGLDHAESLLGRLEGKKAQPDPMKVQGARSGWSRPKCRRGSCRDAPALESTRLCGASS